MPGRPPKLLGLVALALLAAWLLYIGNLALAQFTPKCADTCPSLIEMILRAIGTFMAGLIVLAGAGWWIMFNIILPNRKADTEVR